MGKRSSTGKRSSKFQIISQNERATLKKIKAIIAKIIAEQPQDSLEAIFCV